MPSNLLKEVCPDLGIKHRQSLSRANCPARFVLLRVRPSPIKSSLLDSSYYQCARKLREGGITFVEFLLFASRRLGASGTITSIFRENSVAKLPQRAQANEVIG